MLEVNEIFGPTIQGEGKRIGNPSIFVRFGRCNMSCEGFGVEYKTPNGTTKFSCDSYYASDSAFSLLWDRYESSEQLIKNVNKILPSYKVDIVLTGGEPLLYWKDIQFQNFLKYYIDLGYHITIETNGSLDIALEHNWQKKILFSISVKLSNAKEPISKRININALNHIIKFQDEAYLKFVIGNDFLSQAKEEIDIILSNINSDVDVYLMPLGNTAQMIDKNSIDVIQMAIDNGFKYSDRLHIRAWNNKRGV